MDEPEQEHYARKQARIWSDWDKLLALFWQQRKAHEDRLNLEMEKLITDLMVAYDASGSLSDVRRRMRHLLEERLK